MKTHSALGRAAATLEEAKHEVEAAELELEKMLSEMRIAPRAEKTTVSAAIESALQRLRTARAKVEDAEKTLAKESEQEP